MVSLLHVNYTSIKFSFVLFKEKGDQWKGAALVSSGKFL